MVSPAVQGQVPHPSIVPEFLRSTSYGMTSARGHGAIVYCLNSGSEDRQTGRHNGKVEPAWRDGQVCPDVGQGTTAPWARRPGCVLTCDAQIGRGRPRDFCDLPIRRDEGRVVDTPLVFQRGSFSGEGEDEREREEREKRKKERRKEKGEETEGEERGDGKGEKKESERERERGARLVWRKGLSPEIGVKKTMNAGGVENRID
ncbi:hypothetical protein TNCV_740361 [Trichonephila clavipes]|nr:hypothetical protein TNCV_740361 [Trichonephila clavipes]